MADPGEDGMNPRLGGLNFSELVHVCYFINYSIYSMVVTYPSASMLWDTFMSVLYTAIELYVPERAVLDLSVTAAQTSFEVHP